MPTQAKIQTKVIGFFPIRFFTSGCARTMARVRALCGSGPSTQLKSFDSDIFVYFLIVQIYHISPFIQLAR